MIQQVLFYKDQHGYWPQKVVADQIYGSLENRNYLKKIGVQFQVKPLGRPAKTPKKTKEKPITRNDIEGKFGEGKNGFNLDEIRATRSDTSKSWIAAIFFVMDINEAFRRTEQWLLRFKTVISAMFRATHSASTYSGALARKVYETEGETAAQIAVEAWSPGLYSVKVRPVKDKDAAPVWVNVVVRGD